MAFHRFFKALIALALFVGATLAGPVAVAAAPAMPGHQGAAMTGSHCAAMPEVGKAAPAHHDHGDSSCCTAPCLGTAVAPSVAMVTVDPIADQPALAVVKTFVGVLAEIATPPPRLA